MWICWFERLVWSGGRSGSSSAEGSSRYGKRAARLAASSASVDGDCLLAPVGGGDEGESVKRTDLVVPEPEGRFVREGR